jgi:hypothetical protein
MMIMILNIFKLPAYYLLKSAKLFWYIGGAIVDPK